MSEHRTIVIISFFQSGTPRQDVPDQVYRDAAMFDDVFDRQGRLFTGRKTPKITNPLNSLEYNRLAHHNLVILLF